MFYESVVVKFGSRVNPFSIKSNFDPKAVKESCQAEILRLDKIIKECDEKIAAAELPYMDFDAEIFAKRSPIKTVPKFIQSGLALHPTFKMAKSLENCTYYVQADSVQNLRGQLANRVIGTISCDVSGVFTMKLLANPDGTVYELVPKPVPPSSKFGVFQ
jgi:hypothetical protein